MAHTPPSDPLADLAARQYGLITLEQALVVGWTRAEIDRRLEERSWVAVRRGVFRSAASPVTWRQRALAACIDPGGALAVSHASAAYLHGLLTGRPFVIDVLIPYGSSPHGLAKTVRTHRTRSTPNWREIVTIEGVRTTCLARTLVDIAQTGGSVAHAVPIAELLDRAMVAGRSDRARALLAAQVAQRCCQGRRGTTALRTALEPWSSDASNGARPQSVLEAQVLRAITRGRLPPPQLQYRLDLPTGAVFLDFAWPDRRVALEVDGYRFHSGKATFDRDRVRGNALLLAGWNVLHTTSAQLDEDAGTLLAMLRSALGNSVATRRR